MHQPTFSLVLATINIAPGTFLAIVATAAAAGTVAALVTGRGVIVPVVVVELMFGVVLGPQVLGLHVDQFIGFFSDLGLGLLFFFAGYEIDLRRIRGAPLRLALLGWMMSLALAYAIGGVLAAAGIVLSLLYTGSSLSTTAIGTLIPILSDTGELRTRFGTYLLAAGAVGEPSGSTGCTSAAAAGRTSTPANCPLRTWRPTSAAGFGPRSGGSKRWSGSTPRLTASSSACRRTSSSSRSMTPPASCTPTPRTRRCWHCGLGCSAPTSRSPSRLSSSLACNGWPHATHRRRASRDSAGPDSS